MSFSPYDKRIYELSYLSLRLHELINMEIQETLMGRPHSPERIEEGLEHAIEERTAYIKRVNNIQDDKWQKENYT